MYNVPVELKRNIRKLEENRKKLMKAKWSITFNNVCIKEMLPKLADEPLTFWGQRQPQVRSAKSAATAEGGSGTTCIMLPQEVPTA